MGKKKTTPTTGSTGLPAIRIGSRVRCTDDGIEGRIAWANAVAVKIKWDDGEQVTWKRAELASKPIAFLDADDAGQPEVQAEQPAVESAPESPTTPEPSAAEPAVAVPLATEPLAMPEATAADQEATVQATTEPVGTPDAPAAETHEVTPATLDTTTPTALEMPGSANERKRRRELQAARRKARKSEEPTEKKPSALDAAARVLAEAGQMMTCKEMIGAMAAKGYWSSPGGKTPDATLCAAILREIKVKGDQSRFVKAAPGRFVLRTTM